MNLVRIISTNYDDAKRRIVKFLRFGKSDVQTSIELSPAGFDSNPIKDMVALYAPTGKLGKTVIIGYINKNQLAKPGERRIYSTNSTGDQQAYIWLKDTGIIEVNGDDDFMVRYAKLEEGFNKLRDDFNDFVISKYNVHVHPGVTSGSSSSAPTANFGGSSVAEISGAKNDKIKTNKS